MKTEFPQVPPSPSLKQVYEKVCELKNLRIAEMPKSNTVIGMYKAIEHVPRVEIKIGVNVGEELMNKRAQVNLESKRKEKLERNFTVGTSPLKLKTQNQPELFNTTKSKRLLNFLQSSKTPKPILLPLPPASPSSSHISSESFTPIRSVSQTSHHSPSLSSPSLTVRSSKVFSSKGSSGGYSQAARLGAIGNGTTGNSSGKYLRKGHRLRENLYKCMEMPEDIEEKEELIYMKDFDQWVPASLASFKKLELEHFLNILVGDKKKQTKVENTHFEPIYL